MHENIVECISYQRGADSCKSHTRELHKTTSTHFDNILVQLEELLYMVGDSPKHPTEDELMNYVIGMIESVKVKKLQSTQNFNTITGWQDNLNIE